MEVGAAAPEQLQLCPSLASDWEQKNLSLRLNLKACENSRAEILYPVNFEIFIACFYMISATEVSV